MAWNRKNKASMDAASDRYQSKNRDKIAEKARERRKNPDVKSKEAAATARYYADNSERIKQNAKERRKNNLLSEEKKAEAKARATAWNAKNKERRREIMRASRVRNPAPMNAITAKRRSMKLQATPEWANEFFVKEAYSLAKLRESIVGGKWHVDHVVPLKSKIVCGLHCEQNLNVIPATVNVRKNNRYWPDMP